MECATNKSATGTKQNAKVTKTKESAPMGSARLEDTAGCDSLYIE